MSPPRHQAIASHRRRLEAAAFPRFFGARFANAGDASNPNGVPAFPGNAHGPTADHPSTAGGGALAFPGNARTTGPCGQIYGHSLGIGLTQAMPNAPPRRSLNVRPRAPADRRGPRVSNRALPPCLSHLGSARPPRCPAAFQQHSPAGGEPAYRSAISAETNQAAWYGAKSMRGSRRSQEYPPRSSWASKPSRRARTSWRSATVSPVKL